MGELLAPDAHFPANEAHDSEEQYQALHADVIVAEVRKLLSDDRTGPNLEQHFISNYFTGALCLLSNLIRLILTVLKRDSGVK